MLNGHLFLCFKDLFWFFMILWHSTLGWPWLHRIVKKVHNVLYKVTLTRSQGSVILTCIQANDVEQLPLKVCMLVFSATKCCYRRWILQTWSVITLCIQYSLIALMFFTVTWLHCSNACVQEHSFTVTVFAHSVLHKTSSLGSTEPIHLSPCSTSLVKGQHHS